MQLFQPEFLSALAAIVIIDLVLAGDNAIVIALAARKLPQHLRRRAVVWGTIGAIVVRSTMTVAVVWLLKIPGLLFAGGLLLVWIAFKLLAPAAPAEHTVLPREGFWAAMQTIVVADAIMGLDNVLAVAGAAHGNYLLVILGLLISIPIVIWGSTLILRLVDRYPGIVYLGAGVLAWTAAKMIVSEPLLADWFAPQSALTGIVYITVIGGVMLGGFHVAQRHRQVRALRANALLRARLAPEEAGASQGDRTMSKVLIPVDGSANSLQALQHVIHRCLQDSRIEVHLLNVQTPLSRSISQFLRRGDVQQFYRDKALAALRPAQQRLERAGVRYTEHIETGNKAALIAALAQRLGCDQIVMGTARKNSLTRMVQDSVTNEVLELATVPVEIIAGASVSRLEKYGIPAGLGAALALLLFAGD
jgi:YjbE family integral membrane protein